MKQEREILEKPLRDQGAKGTGKRRVAADATGNVNERQSCSLSAVSRKTTAVDSVQTQITSIPGFSMSPALSPTAA